MTDDTREADLLELVIEHARRLVPAITQELALQIEMEIRQKYGGERVRIAKRRRHPTADERKEIFQAGLTGASDEEITKKFRIGRRSLARYMKSGG